VRHDLLEHRPHQLTELSQVGAAAFAADQQSAKLLFKLLDRSRE
jgi:hypothetical protein